MEKKNIPSSPEFEKVYVEAMEKLEVVREHFSNELKALFVQKQEDILVKAREFLRGKELPISYDDITDAIVDAEDECVLGTNGLSNYARLFDGEVESFYWLTEDVDNALRQVLETEFNVQKED